MQIPRSHGNKREKGHIKDMWCPKCGVETKFREVPKGDYAVSENGIIY